MMKMRIGTGYDAHRLVDGRPLMIGCTEIPYEKGLLGHSDADVLAHAIADALFGAIGDGDIGRHFPDNADEYKGTSGTFILSETAEIIREKGAEIVNIDSTVIAQAPKLAPYIEQMRTNIAEALGICPSAVSVKGKTEEKMGFTGSGEGISAQAVCLIELKD